ncbi:MltF family protein [Desulfoplanes sp.]
MRTSIVLVIHIIVLVAAETLLVGHLVTPGHPPRRLRVAFVPSGMTISRLSPYGPGFGRELVERFCKEHRLEPEWIVVDSPDQGFELVDSDRADILIAAHGSRHAQPSDRFVSGPRYMTDHPLVVHNRWKHGLVHARDICKYTLPISPHPALRSAALSLAQAIGCPNIGLLPIGPGLRPLLAEMARNRTRFAIVGANDFRLWQPFFPDIRPSFPVHRFFGTRWIWQKTDHSNLDAQLASFWSGLLPSLFFTELKARYFGFFPDSTDFYELDHIQEIIDSALPRYRQTIVPAAAKNGLDPLLLTAMIYQESHFNPRARSKTGVRGLLQISRITARELGIANRLDPRQSIFGGARYLRRLIDRLHPLGLDQWNTLFLALAAYNQGMGHLQDAIDLAKKLGRQSTGWREVKEVFPLLSYRKYYQDAPHGYCRGIEAVDYVDSIRYYYYYLTGLVRLDRPASGELSLLLDPGLSKHHPPPSFAP